MIVRTPEAIALADQIVDAVIDVWSGEAPEVMLSAMLIAFQAVLRTHPEIGRDTPALMEMAAQYFQSKAHPVVLDG